MDATYFERLHKDEERRAEWRLLDEALATRRHSGAGSWGRLRRAIGRMMIRAGTQLAGQLGST